MMINILTEEITIEIEIDEDNLLDNEVLDENLFQGNNLCICLIEVNI